MPLLLLIFVALVAAAAAVDVETSTVKVTSQHLRGDKKAVPTSNISLSQLASISRNICFVLVFLFLRKKAFYPRAEKSSNSYFH